MISKALKFILLCAASLLFLLSFGLVFIYVQSLWSPPSINSLEQDAAQGDAEAQYQLALRYKNGTGTPQNLPKAIELFTKAAEQNHAKALHSLGYLYIKGIGVTKDVNTARTFFEKSAALNFDEAMYNLGLMYQDGIGTQQDYQKAFSLFEQADKLGNFKATAALGHMYHNGLGREKDLIKAFSYYVQAAKDGSASAQYALGGYYEYGKGNISKDLTKAREWYEKSASQNFPDALLTLGAIYFDGKGVQQDYLKSGEYYARAVAIGDTKAIDFLNKAKKSCLKEFGRNIRIYDYPMCFIAAAVRDPVAMEAVGNAYYKGSMKQDVDYEKAFSWFLPCAEYGYAPCQMQLAALYSQGQGVEKNKVEAYAWINTALIGKDLNEAERQNSAIMLNLINQELTDEEKIKAEKKAREYEQLYSTLPQ